MEVNRPEIVAEVIIQSERYETALTANQVDVLDELFWDDLLAVRYGGRENIYGHDAISSFRLGRSPDNLEREILSAVVTTFGRDLAVTSTEFRRTRSGCRGRQSQTWVRTDEGWRIVAAHVSQLDLQPVSR